MIFRFFITARLSSSLLLVECVFVIDEAYVILKPTCPIKLKFYFKCMDLGMFPKSIAPSSDVLLELWFNNNHSDLKALFLFLNVR